MKRRDSDRSERGAALVELSLVLSMFAVIAMGILEYGNLFGGTIDLAAAARDGARAGVASSTTVPTDDQVIASVLGRSKIKASDLDRLVIYESTTPDGKPPAPCLTAYPAAPGAKCNIYRSEDLATASNWSTSAGANNWTTADRETSSEAGDVYLGVYLVKRNTSLAKLVWTPAQSADRAVMLLEKPGAEYGTNAGTTPLEAFQNGMTVDNTNLWHSKFDCAKFGCTGGGGKSEPSTGGAGG